MEAIFTIIGQDLEVAIKAIEVDDYDTVNIVVNRIMMNLFIAEDIKLMLIGYMIRELAGELRVIKTNKNDFYEDSKKETIAYLKDLKSLITDGNRDLKIYWERFIDMEIKLRKSLLSKDEGIIYDEQSDFTKEFSIKLLDTFYSLKKDIHALKNHAPTMAFELGRNFNQHGGREALIIYLVFKAFIDYYSYFFIETEQSLNKNKVKRSEDKLGEYIEEIYDLKSCISDMDVLYIKSNLIIDALGRDVRLYYLSYGYIKDERAEQNLEFPKMLKGG